VSTEAALPATSPPQVTAHQGGPAGEGMRAIVPSEKEARMEQWEYYVANVELKEIDGSYTWVCAIGRETIVGLPPLLKRFGLAGWELITLIPLRQTTVSETPAVMQVEILMATFKRRLGSSDDSPSVHPLAPEIAATGAAGDVGVHNTTAPASEAHP
jgi:hypothetical protein